MATVDHKIIGIDLGTTKVSVVIGEVGEGGEISIVGVGTAPAQGMRRGMVINIEQASSAIQKALDEAKRMAGVEIESVYVGVAGEHIKSINSRGVIAIARKGGNVAQSEIRQDDIDRVIDAAKAVSMPTDRQIIHVLPQLYTVDDSKGIRHPLGQAGVRLEADVHIITGSVASIQNVERCVERAGVTVQDIILEPLASSYAILEDNERDLGVGMLDFGGGTTDIALFEDGVIKHSHILPVGGQLVTRDIAVSLNIHIDQAEKLKIEFGLAHKELIPEDRPVPLPSFGSRPESSVMLSQLTKIIQYRMREIFEFARDEIIRMMGVNYHQKLPAGLILTGGGSMVRGSDLLASEVFGFPVQVRGPRGVVGLKNMIESPIYSTGVGIILYAVRNAGWDRGLVKSRKTNSLGGLFLKIKLWIIDFFS
jgi:cell division protein FtsA